MYRDMEQSINNDNANSLNPEEISPNDLVDTGINSDIEALGSPKDTNEVDKAEAKQDELKSFETSEDKKLDTQLVNDLQEDAVNVEEEKQVESVNEIRSLEISETKNENGDKEVSDPEEEEPVFDGTEVPGMESGVQGPAWPEKAVALTQFVRQKSIVAMSTVLRRLSGRSDDGQDATDVDTHDSKVNGDSSPETETQEVPQKSGWNPLSLIGVSRDGGGENKGEPEDAIEDLTVPLVMKGRIIVYTKLGCQVCKEMRRYLHQKRLRYVEINIDVYPTRKLELEKIAGSSDVPKVFFNEVLIGGWNEIRSLEGSGKLEEKIEYVVTETPAYEAPLPPLSGEDDLSSSGAIDELALIVRKMKGSISVKDRFYKMRRFTSCFLGSEAVDFLSEDQYLEREEVSCIL